MNTRRLCFLFAGAFFLVSLQPERPSALVHAQSTNGPAADLKGAPPAKLAQLMRGIMLPNSNVIFFAESKNPADVVPAKNASGAVNPLEGTYGKWDAVENSSLAIAEATSLLTEPGRFCSNGRPVPIENPDWPKLVAGLRSAALQAYSASETRNQDKVGDAADVLSDACSKCHVKYRDTPRLEDRCEATPVHTERN